MKYLKLSIALYVFILTACNGGNSGGTANTTATAPPVDITPSARNINDTTATGEAIWVSQATGAPISGSMAIADDGTVYTFSQNGIGLNGFLIALNQDGTLKWTLDTGTSFTGSSTTPSIGPDGTIYIGADTLIAVNPAGEIKWRFALIDNASSPAIDDDGTLYVVDDFGFIYAVNPDGTEKWSLNTGASHALASGVVIDSLSNIYYATDNDTIIAINSAGTLLWESDFHLSHPTTPSIGGDGTLYTYFSSDGTVVAINPTDGSKKWTKFIGGNSVDGSGVSIGIDETIYVANSNDPAVIYALNPVNGSEIWTSTIAGEISVTPAISDIGTLYLSNKAGDLWALESDGTVKWRIVRPLSFDTLGSPVIDNNGAVYFSTGSGNVIAVSTDATGQGLGKWPMYSFNAKHTGRVN